VNRIIFIFALSLPLFPYSVEIAGIGFSIDRFLFFMLLFVFLIQVISSGKLRVNTAFYFCLLGLFGLILTTLLSGGSQHSTLAMAFYCSTLMCLLVILPDSSLASLEKGLVRAFFVYLLFFVYGLFTWYTTSQSVTVIPFSEYIPFLRETRLEHAATYSGSYSIFPRFAFPFATPPHLSIVGASYAIYFLHLLSLGEKAHASGRMLYLLFFMAFCITFATISRSGIFSMFAGCLTYLLLTRQQEKLRYGLGLLLILIIGAVFFYMYDPLAASSIYERLSNTDVYNAGASGHFSARLDAVSYFLDYGFMKFLFGEGVGNYPELHAHMSFLTILVERGVVGFIALVGLFLTLLIGCWKMLSNVSESRRQEACFGLAIGVMLVLGHSAYEFSYVVILWVFFALAVRRASMHI
jgi:hypothetical protein